MNQLKIEFRKNGGYQMRLTGGDEVDAAMLQAMANAAAANPASTTITYLDGVATVTVEVRK